MKSGCKLQQKKEVVVVVVMRGIFCSAREEARACIPAWPKEKKRIHACVLAYTIREKKILPTRATEPLLFIDSNILNPS
jgi:hypothetical protein